MKKRNFRAGVFLVGIFDGHGGTEMVVDGYYVPDRFSKANKMTIDVWVTKQTLIKLYDGPYLMGNIIKGAYPTTEVDGQTVYWIGESLPEPITILPDNTRRGRCSHKRAKALHAAVMDSLQG